MKRCTKCGYLKPASDFDIDRRRDGLRSWCKDCEADYQRDQRARQRSAAPPPAMERLCPCGSGITVRRSMQQNRGGRMTPGRWPLCDSCKDAKAKATRQEYRESHREQRRKYNQQYREENREEILASGRERARINYEADPEKYRQRHRNWYRKLRAKILAHYGTSCACCGGTNHLGIDHVNGNGREHREELFGNPRHGGGTRFYLWLVENDFPEDYQALCRPCNRSKGTGTACTLDHQDRPAPESGNVR